ncbi:2OG-Fe(II) oxygenase [Streptomyces lunalinharesii]|uniref:Prolyl 4-hydroxylase alpha subunit domain-containing protein n=1 Tax=Streptomyces lunalinharesii TaxID=333384 RepID=A0ABN3SPS5_9ACTN
MPDVPSPPDATPSRSPDRLLDLSALRRAELAERPYRWAEIPDTLCDGPAAGETARRLEAEFPTRGFHLTERTGHGAEKTYRTRNLPLITQGRPVADSRHALTPLWRRLVDELAAPEYRAAVAEATGRRLDHCAVEARAVRYGPGYWIAPHTDRADKVVTQLWYFNSQWPAHWRGTLRILGSCAPDDVTTEVAPHQGSSVLLVRSADSWHSVTPVSADARQDRRTLLLHFIDPTADTGSGHQEAPPDDRTLDDARRPGATGGCTGPGPARD